MNNFQHLESDCINKRDLCRGTDCCHAVKEGPGERWFITMGHPGFNSPANNRDGYATQAKALGAVKKYSSK